MMREGKQESGVSFPTGKAYSLLTHEDFVFSKLQLLHGDHVFAINCCLQGSLVDQIFQVSAREAHCAPGNNFGLNSCRDDTQHQQSSLGLGLRLDYFLSKVNREHSADYVRLKKTTTKTPLLCSASVLSQDHQTKA